MDNIIEASHLVKSYKEEIILDGLNFSIKRGSVVGILGNNGAGKTTLIQTMLGFLRPSSGTCKIFDDHSPNLSDANKHKIGYVPQEAELIPWMKVSQIVSYTKGFYKSWDDQLIPKLLEDWQLPLDQTVEKLSLGQKQKLAIILALGHSPELLILDEPVASLDPVARRQFIKKLVDLNIEQNNTIVFSTHITSDLERVAAEVLIVKDGRNYYQGDIDELKEKFVKLTLRGDTLKSSKPNISGLVSYKQKHSSAIAIVQDVDQIDLTSMSQDMGINIQVTPMNLEDIFVEIHS